MAGLKKASKRRDTTNPNTVLVLFLVFFVLLSIGLGTWGYFGYAGQEDLRQKAEKAKLESNVASLGADYNLYLSLEGRQAIGIPLNADDLKVWEITRDQFFIEGGKFKNELFKNRPEMLKMIEDIKRDLGYDEAAKRYATTYREKHKKLAEDAKKAQGDLIVSEKKFKEANDELQAIRAKVDASWKTLLAKIQEGSDAALKTALAKSAQMEESFRRNQDLQNQIEKIGGDHRGELEKMNARLNDLEAKRKKAEALAASVSSTIVRTSSEPHALLMDISRGKPMWDEALGKITKIDNKQREVYLDIGSSIGVKPGLSLNVFGGSWKGKKAEGIIKGSLEVIQVLGPTSCRARITSLYDPQGAEIVLNDQTRGRTQREVDNAFKDGDLVFNMIFGTHVVLAGNIHWNGSPSDSPAEQMRNLREFMAILERQGVKVDAYLDLADGKLKGVITPKTRLLVRGDPVAGEERKDINDAIKAVRAEAIEKGMFIIAADNLANVIGYRRPRSANDIEATGFRPTLPFAGADR